MLEVPDVVYVLDVLAVLSVTCLEGLQQTKGRLRPVALNTANPCTTFGTSGLCTIRPVHTDPTRPIRPVHTKHIQR